MGIPEVPPFLWLLAGALLLPFLPSRVQAFSAVAFPALALAAVWSLDDGIRLTLPFLQYELVVCRVDALSRVFGVVFALIAAVGGVYSWHLRETGQRVAALLYAGGALGVTFAGDYLTLLVFWELMAVSSAYLIWARRTAESAAAGMRYLLAHLAGGSLLMAGIAMHVAKTGSLEMAALAPRESVAAWFILAGVALNAAIPPLHGWLPDSYHKATVTGAVFLSAFTTKSAVFVLARLFPGWDLLIFFGVAMALYGAVYALLANDIRQILAYSIISQVGYMVAAVGIGTALALNGMAAHAFSHILYKALLLMAAGVVLETTGRSKLTELGGLGKHMPMTFWLYMVGAFSISGFPLFNGFVSKSVIITAAGEGHYYGAKFLLILASVGSFLHTGLKLPYWTWHGRDIGLKPDRAAPINMLAAMVVLAALCVLCGVMPGLLYRLLPHPMDYQPYTVPHLVESIQILVFAFVAFWWLRQRTAAEPKIALDADWFYRRPAEWARRFFVEGVCGVFEGCQGAVNRLVSAAAAVARNPLPSAWARGEAREDYDPDKHRFPLELGVALTLMAVIAAALWMIF